MTRWTLDNHPEYCKSGNHRLTQDNLYIRNVRGTPSLTCRACHIANEIRWSATKAKRRGYHRDLCRKQLHKLTKDNLYTRKDGSLVCATCRKIRMKQGRERLKSRYTVLKCDAIGCVASTKRLKPPRWWLCKKHQLNPPIELIRFAVHDPDLAKLVRNRVAA